jgi:hypothetical protein
VRLVGVRIDRRGRGRADASAAPDELAA